MSTPNAFAVYDTDLLIIGGGTAGCYAAIIARRENPDLKVLVVDKAHIDRSGCLAGGMNAINAYINPGETVDSFVEYVREDAMGILREDLVRTQAALFSEVVATVEAMGLPIVKDPDGKYSPRGRWNIKIHGESLKPILAREVRRSGAEVLDRVVVTDLVTIGGAVHGAVGFSLKSGEPIRVSAKKTIVATGGASGLYRPNNEGRSRHKMWYSPFNAGAGYAIGIRAGAEMTSFEHRFIALRTKDTIAPTGTLALGFGAPQVNSKGEEFMKRRWADKGGEGAPTPLRLEAPLREIEAGNGPCFMDTRHLGAADLKRLYEAYLDMYPNTVLYWAANNDDLTRTPVEICGTEPYLVGGHCQAGYWVDVDRRTTLPNLFAAGDVAGGAPYKFVSGCFAEGAIAARAASREIREEKKGLAHPGKSVEAALLQRTLSFLSKNDKVKPGSIRPDEAESRLQKIMDEYAGGLRTSYRMNEAGLLMAKKKLDFLLQDLGRIEAEDAFALMGAHEVADRLDVAQVLVEHLLARRETRWPGFQSRQDWPNADRRYEHFINSIRENEGTIRIIHRSLSGEILPWEDEGFQESLGESAIVTSGTSVGKS